MLDVNDAWMGDHPCISCAVWGINVAFHLHNIINVCVLKIYYNEARCWCGTVNHIAAAEFSSLIQLKSRQKLLTLQFINMILFDPN